MRPAPAQLSTEHPAFSALDANRQTLVTGLKQQAVRGGLFILGRAVAVRGLYFLGLVLLARFTTPANVGEFVIVSFTVGFLGAIGDGGLAAALIQQDHTPTEKELSTVFTVQTLIAAAILTATAIALIPLAGPLHLGLHGYVLVLGLLSALPLTLLKTLPAARLERDLRYGPLAAVDALQALVFQAVAVGLGLLGFGLSGFVLAAIAQAGVGAVFIAPFSPWWVHFGIDRGCLRRLVSFGAMFQAQTAINYVKDSMTPLFVGAVIGATAVGYLNWAYTLAAIPLLIAYPLSDVTFPLFARARQDAALLRAMVERSIHVCALTVLPISVLTIVGAGRLVDVVFGERWHPALPALYIFAIAMWTGPLIGSSFFSLFYATGRARLALGFTLSWTCIDWALGVPLVLHFGFIGIAWRTLAVAALSTPILIAKVRAIVPVRILRQVMVPAILAISAGLVEWCVYTMTTATWTSTILGVAVASVVYALLACMVEQRFLRSLVDALRRRSSTPRVVPESSALSTP
jgi:O-antigen/teichoic acid export membrane protein